MTKFQIMGELRSVIDWHKENGVDDDTVLEIANEYDELLSGNKLVEIYNSHEDDDIEPIAILEEMWTYLLDS